MSEFNFTNRRDIPSEFIKVEDVSTQVQNRLIIRDLDLSSFSFPDDAHVWLSAQRGYLYQRFDLGQPSAPSIGSTITLDSFDSVGLGSVILRLLVVRFDGKLLGACRPFRLPSSGRQFAPLLDMKQRDLGQEIWQLELDEETGPLLLVNSRLIDPESIVSNPLFVSCVLPSLLKQIAVWMMSTEVDDGPDTVPGKWLQFFDDLGVEVRYETSRTYNEIIETADEAARLLASKHSVLDNYVRWTEGTMTK